MILPEDAEAWALYFSLFTYVSDNDLMRVNDWYLDILNACNPDVHYSDWYTQADGNWTTTWSGYVDLTTPGTYTLTALLTNEVPEPYDCFPLDDPSTPENEWVPGWGDDGPICLEYTVTVLTVDLDFPDLDDANEEEWPGGLLGMNDDDDDADHIPDLEQDEIAERPVNGENDLVAISLGGNWAPLEPSSAYCTISWDAPVRVWENADKSGAEIPNGVPIPWTHYGGFPSPLFVEGIAPGSGGMALRAVDPSPVGVPACLDQILIQVVRVDIDAGCGESEEESLGVYVNVNWDDDDRDGWTNNGNPPDAVYTGDKDDSTVDGGDDDLREALVSLTPNLGIGLIRLTYTGGVKVWRTNTKSTGVASGTLFNANELPLVLYVEGFQGSATFRDVEMKAEYIYQSSTVHEDIAKVTVFEVQLAGIFSGNRLPDNEASFEVLLASSNKKGQISWDDPDDNCYYFHNCMEDQGTVSPAGVTTEVSFDSKRDVQFKYWYGPSGPWVLQKSELSWKSDDSANDDEDNTPSPDNHIYQIDGPGITTKKRFAGIVDQAAEIANFRDHVVVFIGGQPYQCSDYFKWSSRVQIGPKNDTEMTRAGTQLLGAGWITLPESP